MAYKVFNKIMIAHGNLVSPAAVTAIVTNGISAFEGGFPASNLEYPDPWTMMKTAGIVPAASIWVEHQFAASQAPKSFGLINHNLFTAGYVGIFVEWWNGVSWSTIDSGTVIVADQDIILAWDDSASSTRWRFRLSTDEENFFVGSVFYGIFREFDINVAREGVSQIRQSPIAIEQSAGSARHVSFNADRKQSDMSLSWERASFTDRWFFEQRPHDELLGILSPEHGDAMAIGMIGSPPVWGYVDRIEDSPRGPGMHLTGQPARYDFTVFLRGAS